MIGIGYKTQNHSNQTCAPSPHLLRTAAASSDCNSCVDVEKIDNLLPHVDRLAGLIGGRTLQKPKTITATIGYIEEQWSEMGYSIDRECYDAIGDEATNLIVEQAGTKRADEIVLLGLTTTPSFQRRARTTTLRRLP